jgi:WXG100 protein secretion system (Wss), protein YukD
MANIKVVISDATGIRNQEATVPDDAQVIRLIARLIELMDLPVSGPDGQPLSYKFHHRASGRQLKDTDTLVESGVSEGDTLRLVAEITAG